MNSAASCRSRTRGAVPRRSAPKPSAHREKATVHLWSQATPADRPAFFAAAQAVRRVEIGLGAVFSLALAATTLLFGLVLVRSPRGRPALGAVALVTAATATAGTILFGRQAFSTTMNLGAAAVSSAST